MSAATGEELRKALVIGVSEYPNYPEAERLKYAANDARRFADLLKTSSLGRFEVTFFLRLGQQLVQRCAFQRNLQGRAVTQTPVTQRDRRLRRFHRG
jgi:hypothetical protein